MRLGANEGARDALESGTGNYGLMFGCEALAEVRADEAACFYRCGQAVGVVSINLLPAGFRSEWDPGDGLAVFAEGHDAG